MNKRIVCPPNALSIDVIDIYIYIYVTARALFEIEYFLHPIPFDFARFIHLIPRLDVPRTYVSYPVYDTERERKKKRISFRIINVTINVVIVVILLLLLLLLCQNDPLLHGHRLRSTQK